VEAVRFLECHSTREGIFRKAGSVTRQKALKVSFLLCPLPLSLIICTTSLSSTQAALDSSNPSIPPDSNVHDVACLLKQYLRELPEPLITSHLLPVFEGCYSLFPEANRQRCMLLACLLLPQMHLRVCHRSTTYSWYLINAYMYHPLMVWCPHPQPHYQLFLMLYADMDWGDFGEF
jgi:hypothetical protein